MVLMLAASLGSDVQAQTQCTTLWDNSVNGTPITPTGYNWSQNFVMLTRLGNYHMPQYGSGDSMTEPFSLNGGSGTRFGSETFRETWYVPKNPATGTAPFYRLLGGADHMDSDNPNEASSLGYAMEFTLGNPWTSALPGTKALTRYRSTTAFEHRTWMNTQTPSGYTLSARWDGTSAPARYGYERHGNLQPWCEVEKVAYLNNSISNSKLKIEFHKIWGNAIGRITWLPTGHQLVREEIGAMVQSTIFHKPAGELCCDYNPTQSGGVDLANFGNTNRWAGSPVLSASKTATSHVTEVKPFNFSFNEWTDTDALSPLMWKGTFKKTTTLGLSIGTTTYEDVFLMRFEAKRDDGGVDAANHNLNNTYWLSMAPLGDGRYGQVKMESVNLDTGATTLRPNPSGLFNDGTDPANPTNVDHPPTDQGVMISRVDGTLAMGFHTPGAYDPLRTVRGYDLMWWCDGGTKTNCEPQFQAFVFNSFRDRTVGLNYADTPAEDTYMIVGTRATVIRRLRQLKCKLNGGLPSTCNAIP